VVAVSAVLRILIANERRDRLELLAQMIAGMGHEVVAREIEVGTVGAVTAKVRPDVAIVGLGASSEHALDLVSAIVREAFCPVIAILTAYDEVWLRDASRRGVYAYLLDGNPSELQSALDITLGRFLEYQAMQGAFDRRGEESAREAALLDAKRRHALELHDEVVQGLAVAQLALDLGREGQSREALNSTLTRARAIVTRQLRELQDQGHPIEQLIADAAPVVRDG
jgi:AmiR/NasT family two-component response regulator